MEGRGAWWLAGIVQSSDAAIVGCDLTGKIVSWNPGAERLFGLSAVEAAGGAVSMLFANGELDALLERVGRGERVGELELTSLRRDGGRTEVAVVVSPILEPGAGVAGASMVIRDISPRKRVERELRRSNADLERFAHVVSHDLSEPLRVVAGFVEMLQRRYRARLDEEADRLIEFAIDGVNRMQALIDDLLAFARARRAVSRPAEVDSSALVREVLATLGDQILQRGAQVTVADLPTLRAPPAVLRQVLQNLIGNAIKFTAVGVPRVHIGATRVSEGWRFDVSDNGPGVDPRHAERIFEMLERLHRPETPGSGMGLAIAKQLVQSCGGRIWVEPRPGGGSVFSFTIPEADVA